MIQALLRLADGWRPKRKNVDFPDAFQIAKQCKVRELYLVWMVDIVKNDEYIQVLRVWDILPLSEIPKLARRLDNIFAMYTDDYIDLCKMQCIEGYTFLFDPFAYLSDVKKIHFRYIHFS